MTPPFQHFSMQTHLDPLCSNASKFEVLLCFIKRRKTNSCCSGLSLYGRLICVLSSPIVLVDDLVMIGQLSTHKLRNSFRVKLVKFLNMKGLAHMLHNRSLTPTSRSTHVRLCSLSSYAWKHLSLVCCKCNLLYDNGPLFDSSKCSTSLLELSSWFEELGGRELSSLSTHDHSQSHSWLQPTSWTWYALNRRALIWPLNWKPQT
jgi:hypothetical protein